MKIDCVHVLYCILKNYLLTNHWRQKQIQRGGGALFSSKIGDNQLFKRGGTGNRWFEQNRRGGLNVSWHIIVYNMKGEHEAFTNIAGPISFVYHYLTRILLLSRPYYTLQYNSLYSQMNLKYLRKSDWIKIIWKNHKHSVISFPAIREKKSMDGIKGVGSNSIADELSWS